MKTTTKLKIFERMMRTLRTNRQFLSDAEFIEQKNNLVDAVMKLS